MDLQNNEEPDGSRANSRQQGRGYPRRYNRNNKRNYTQNNATQGERPTENVQHEQPSQNRNRPYRGNYNRNFRSNNRRRKTNQPETAQENGEADEGATRANVSNNPRRRAHKNKKTAVEIESQRENLIYSLMKGNYECMVCLKELKKRDQIWSCGACYHIFHLKCIKKWSKSGEEDACWRCPACQLIFTEIPTDFQCFCLKVKNPAVNYHEIPFSCGNVCRKSRNHNCIHPCNILCHPGPCPTCQVMVSKKCRCGKISKKVQCCSQASFSCDEKCLKLLNCGIHACTATCHDGPCKPCEEEIDIKCFCQRTSKVITCGASDVEKYFNCDNTCDKLLTCDNHKCKSLCHPGDCDACDRDINSPYCACGKTIIENSNRKSCEDPLPTCDSICNKELGCGKNDERHTCQLKCHDGDCATCTGESLSRCHCGYIEETISCIEYVRESKTLRCSKICNRKLSCGRHKCREKCCTKKEHICEQICGRKLSCELHYCEEPCHKGNCHKCWNVSFDEFFCECGSSVKLPPIACGEKPPECKKPCSRQHSCDHKVSHNCHSDVKCPPCTVLVQKICMGGHEIRNNIPCHLNDISCGLKCAKPLPCGEHKCDKVCHKDECAKTGEECLLKCEKIRENCGHPCNNKCHVGSACPENLCETEISLHCECGRKVMKVPCAPSLRSCTRIRPLLCKDEGAVNLVSLRQTLQKQMIPCDEVCASILRKKQMAEALGIDPDRQSTNSTYTEFLKNAAKLNPQFVGQIETSLRELVISANLSKSNSRSHSFQAMSRDKRHIIHELAEFYFCTTLSYDEEPYKNVVATAKKGVAKLPNMSLIESTQRSIYGRTMQPPVITELTNEDTKSAEKPPETAECKVIDYFDYDN
ncbi:DgyrCDS6869 [Dimorphilus gyrociliatus]|uniref:DgyrCDS6869 n=1 Tax=Dimorphilus gyrociliatus TaxID=2664684 RepID=A0A7I8VPB2_9ANNE|nr:DgyrCDS6869 [Dimorphilus gyrociliatus]